MCESRHADTAMMPITPFPVHYRGDPVWQRRHEAVSNPEGPHFHAGMAATAEYAQYTFNLQHNTATTVVQQRLCMTTCEERHFVQLKCENDLLCGGTVPPTDQNRELKVAYHHLSEAEQAWHYIHQQLDTSREMVDECTLVIVHLKYANEQHDLKLEERAAVIASLEQQVQVLQL
jgi:hypothetical protein